MLAGADTTAVPPCRTLSPCFLRTRSTHQGILDVAALVVDVLRRYFPLQLDRMDREKALFPGPHPLLLGGISADDLAILLSGSDRNTSQVEFGAHQVILVRSMEAAEKLPEDIRESNAIIMVGRWGGRGPGRGGEKGYEVPTTRSLVAGMPCLLRDAHVRSLLSFPSVAPCLNEGMFLFV